MPHTETVLDLTDLSESVTDAIQRQADAWGMSFDDACVRLLVDRSRQLQAQQAARKPGLFERLFGSAASH